MIIIGIESTQAGWGVYEVEDYIHVVPINDVVFHEQSEECACLPQTEPCLNNDGTVTHYWLVTHGAWDGRQ